MEIKIVEVPIGNLNPSPYNPRIHSEKFLAKLEKSIKEFGLVDPLIANKNNILVGGHARWKVAKKLNYKTVPVIYVDLSKEKEKA